MIRKVWKDMMWQFGKYWNIFTFESGFFNPFYCNKSIIFIIQVFFFNKICYLGKTINLWVFYEGRENQIIGILLGLGGKPRGYQLNTTAPHSLLYCRKSVSSDWPWGIYSWFAVWALQVMRTQCFLVDFIKQSCRFSDCISFKQPGWKFSRKNYFLWR